VTKRPFRAAFVEAADGIFRTLVTQRNFRIQGIIAICVLAVAAILHLDPWSWGILVLSIVLVLASELFNTCLEHLIDLVQPGTHPLARAAKHAGAAAVLAASIGAAAAGCIIFGTAIVHRLRPHW
jgi:diacylglycerol kinase